MGADIVKIAVVSHDAGASELLCALIAHHSTEAVWHIFAAEGSPMALICERHHLSFTPIGDAALQLETLQPDLLLFGTGWQEKIERPYVTYCKNHHIPTVAFLDHWSSYRERFGFPDEQWRENCGNFTAVHDKKALALATSLELPHPLPLRNLYLMQLIENAKAKTVTPNHNLLFLSEPTDEVALRTFGDKHHWGFTQYSALEDILTNFDRFGCEGLTIRLHPSETSAGYKKILKQFPHIRSQINDARTFDLTDQLLSAKRIIGFDTMALYTAALMGKNVISYLPSKTREFFLPFPSSHQLRSLHTIPPPVTVHLDDFGMDFALFLKTTTSKG